MAVGRDGGAVNAARTSRRTADRRPMQVFPMRRPPARGVPALGFHANAVL